MKTFLGKLKLSIILTIAATFVLTAHAKSAQFEIHFEQLSDGTATLTETDNNSGQTYEDIVELTTFQYTIFNDAQIIFNDKQITLYKYCDREFSYIRNGDIILPPCTLTTSNSIDILQVLETHEYIQAVNAVSSTLDQLYNEKANYSPTNHREKVVFWSRLLHNIVQYEYDPSLGWETAESILRRGTGDCKAYALMVHYLLKKDNIEAQPVAVTAGMKRSLNTFHFEPFLNGRDHVAIHLKESGSILEVTDRDKLGTTPLMYSTTTALGVIDGREYEVQSELNIDVTVSDEKIVYIYEAIGADDFFYKFQKIENFEPIKNLHTGIGYFSYSHSFNPIVTQRPNSTTVKVEYSHSKVSEINELPSEKFLYLPLNADFRQGVIKGNNGYSLCYLGNDINLNISGWSVVSSDEHQWESENAFLSTKISVTEDGDLNFLLRKKESDRRCNDSEAQSTMSILIRSYDELLQLGVFNNL